MQMDKKVALVIFITHLKIKPAHSDTHRD